MKLLHSDKGSLIVYSYTRIIFFVMLCCLYGTTVYATVSLPDDSVMVMPFGRGNSIHYHLAYGTYDVLFRSNLRIDKACGFAGGKQSLSSQHTKYHSVTKSVENSAAGNGTKYVITHASQKGQLMEQIFIVYPTKDFFITQLKVKGEPGGYNYMSPLYNATGQLGTKGGNRALMVPFDNDMWVSYNAQGLDTAAFNGSEVSTIFNNDNLHGLVVGSLEHEIWKTGISVYGTSHSEFELTAFGGFTDSTLTHDRKPHGFVMPVNGVCSSPKILVGYFDDWRTGMEVYAKTNLLTEPRFIKPWKSGTPIGWNSWGVLQDKLTLADAKGVVDFFYDSCKTFRTADGSLFIDLDSYWDRLVKGGLDGDASELKAFVAYCNKKGFKPGIYWAPFTDWGKQGGQKVEGSDYKYQDCWTMVNGQPIDIDGGRAMDPTHPATLERIKKYTKFFKNCGFKMIKIDFLGHATLEADYYYNKQVQTGMQAFKVGMEYLDKALDNSMLVYAAISPNLATARYVHMRRIACDAFKRIDETAYTLNSTTFGWWQGQMYDFMDADHVVFDDVTGGENRARLASAIVTGSVITGDDYSKTGKWSSTALHLLQNKALLSLIRQGGKPFRPLVGYNGKDAATVYYKLIGDKIYIAAFNFSEVPRAVTFPYDKLNIKKKIEGEKLMGADAAFIQMEKGGVQINLPAKDAVVYRYPIPKDD